MHPIDDTPERNLCVFKVELIRLLDPRPVGRDQRAPHRLAVRLGRLEQEARRGAAPTATLTAIESARALLALSELPSSPSPHKLRPA